MRRGFGARRPTASGPVLVGGFSTTGAGTDDGRLGPGRRTGVSACWEQADESICGSELSVLGASSTESLRGPGDDSELLE